MINIVTSSRYKINRQKIKLFINEVLEKKGVNPDFSLNVVFVGKTKMKFFTQKYKKENQALPVLAFPYNEKIGDNETLLGEVIICFPLLILLAAERNKRVDEIINELLKHGIENLLN